MPVAQIYNHQGVGGDCALSFCLSSCGLGATLHYLWCYKPKTDFSSSGNVKREPDFVAKCCCPAPTVYYHEQNRINAKCGLACCFGWFYTVPCYHPTWTEQQGGGGSPMVEGQMIREQPHEFTGAVPKTQPEMHRSSYPSRTIALELL
jgi:hypothetical protein